MKNFIFFLTLFFLLFFSCKKMDLIPNQTTPVIVEADSITFAVIGDYGKAGETELRVSQMIESWNPDFIITTGDNNYEDGELATIKENISQYYCDYIYNPDAPDGYVCNGNASVEKLNRFFPVPGNHDYNSKDGIVPYLNYFSLPGVEEYYDFQWGPVHFFALDSGRQGDSECCASSQSVWLKETMANSTRPFKIVYFHHSPYSSAKHGNAERMQWDFKGWGANTVMTGHDHVYSRIHLSGQSDFAYFISGLGGKPTRYDCNANPLDENLFDVFCYQENHGAMLVKANSEKIVFQFFQIDDQNIPVDEFVLMK
jgi:tartrate-resistant acid phosphatase type 5